LTAVHPAARNVDVGVRFCENLGRRPDVLGVVGRTVDDDIRIDLLGGFDQRLVVVRSPVKWSTAVCSENWNPWAPRLSAVTSYPWSRNSATVWRPTNPVPPMTSADAPVLVNGNSDQYIKQGVGRVIRPGISHRKNPEAGL
jgi:hypothetical protein